MSSNDATILAEFARHRDEASFRRLYKRFTPRLFALAVRLCGSRTDAEELTQETWMRAIERHERFDGRSQYSTWLSGILINCFREGARRQARWPQQLDDAGQREANAVIAEFPVAKRLQADPLDLERALSGLPPGYREVVLLHDLNGHTHAEIGAMLGIAEGTSKSQLQRGRTRLRELLDQSSAPDHGERGTS